MPPTEDLSAFGNRQSAASVGRSLGAPGDAADREAALYARYLRVVALLSECAPYVDDPDYRQSIDEILNDAASAYPIEQYAAAR